MHSVGRPIEAIFEARFDVVLRKACPNERPCPSNILARRTSLPVEHPCPWTTIGRRSTTRGWTTIRGWTTTRRWTKSRRWTTTRSSNEGLTNVHLTAARDLKQKPHLCIEAHMDARKRVSWNWLGASESIQLEFRGLSPLAWLIENGREDRTQEIEQLLESRIFQPRKSRP